MKTSPTQRSLKLMRSRGYICAVVERWNHYAKIRQDMFGFVDLVCCGELGEIIFVQTTSGTNVSARIEKIKALPVAKLIAAGPVQIVVHGWRKAGPRGKRKVWECRVVNPFEA